VKRDTANDLPPRLRRILRRFQKTAEIEASTGDPNRIKLSGFSKRSEVDGIDMPLVNLFLQKRWEETIE